MKRVTICWVAAFFLLIGIIRSITPAPVKASDLSTADQSKRPPLVSVRLAKYHVKSAFREKFREALSKYVFSSLKATGNIMSEAYHEQEDPSILWVIERWSEQDLLEKNDGSTAAKNIIPLTKNGLVSPVEIFLGKDLEPLPKEAYRKKPHSRDHPLTIMLFVDAKEGTEDEFKSLYHIAMPAFRNEPGVVTYQLSQVSGDQTKFITYEKFRSPGAFQDHLKVPAVEPVVQYLRTSIKEPPFEKGLHRLIEFAPLYREK